MFGLKYSELFIVLVVLFAAAAYDFPRGALTQERRKRLLCYGVLFLMTLVVFELLERTARG